MLVDLGQEQMIENLFQKDLLYANNIYAIKPKLSASAEETLVEHDKLINGSENEKLSC